MGPQRVLLETVSEDRDEMPEELLVFSQQTSEPEKVPALVVEEPLLLPREELVAVVLRLASSR